MNEHHKPVAVVIGATSKWQSDGRNTKLAHGKPLDDSYPVGAKAIGSTLGDFDGDKNVDIAVGTSGSTLILWGTGHGLFAPAARTANVTEISTATAWPTWSPRRRCSSPRPTAPSSPAPTCPR